MKILNVTQTYYPYQEGGGMPVKVRAISRVLARHGHRVTVLTANLGERQWPANASVEKTSTGRRTFEENVEALYLPTIARYRALTFNPRVVRFCRASLARFDLVHCYGLYDVLGPSVAYFCRREGLPVVVEPMGMFRPIDRSFRAKRAWHLTVGRSFLRKAAKIVATSDLEQQELIAGGIAPRKILLRYNGIDRDILEALPPRGAFRAKWRIPLGDPMILFLGRVIPRKRADLLIRAFADASPGCGMLVIAGPEGEVGYRSLLEKCARDSGVADRVLFTGPLYDDDKKSAFLDADIFALPSQYENFANAPAEAIACGVPVLVSTSCGIAPLIEGRAGLVVSPEMAPLSSALRTLLGNESLRIRLKAGCREVASELNWDRLVGQMEDCYANLLMHGSTNQ
ncbi:MAG TPA: glycosyltransferase [Candidatus Acidoferrales bacterium]|nr:glycosyltransferase [Candidatus Acidoferrales bacterium]